MMLFVKKNYQFYTTICHAITHLKAKYSFLLLISEYAGAKETLMQNLVTRKSIYDNESNIFFLLRIALENLLYSLNTVLGVILGKIMYSRLFGHA